MIEWILPLRLSERYARTFLYTLRVIVCGFHRFVCKNNGVLFENDLVQIGVKSEFRQNLGRLNLFYGNKTVNQFNTFIPDVSCTAPLSSHILCCCASGKSAKTLQILWWLGKMMCRTSFTQKDKNWKCLGICINRSLMERSWCRVGGADYNCLKII